MMIDGRSWARFTSRWVLGLMFFMAGWYKVFEMGAVQHARRLFVEGYADSWIPAWLLWATGTTIPFLELIAGGLVCLGFRLRESLPALGMVLIVVTYGHLLKEPFYEVTTHVLPRLALLVAVWLLPADRDVLSVDSWISRRRAA